MLSEQDPGVISEVLEFEIILAVQKTYSAIGISKNCHQQEKHNASLLERLMKN